MVRLYHYTDHGGYVGIKDSQRINKATRHAFHGNGVYFNSRRVDGRRVTKEDIADENYLGGGDYNYARGYVDYVVVVDFPESDVKCVDSSRHLWLYRTDDHLDLNKYNHFFQEV